MRLILKWREASLERAAVTNKRSPFDPLVPGNFTVTDLIDEELMQIIGGGERQNAERTRRRQRKADRDKESS